MPHSRLVLTNSRQKIVTKQPTNFSPFYTYNLPINQASGQTKPLGIQASIFGACPKPG